MMRMGSNNGVLVEEVDILECTVTIDDLKSIVSLLLDFILQAMLRR